MAFNMLVDQYPGHEEIGKLMLLNAEHWLQAFNGLSNGRAYPNFDFTAYDFETGKGVYNGRWREPDAAAGLGWLFFTTWNKSGDQKFLQAAQASMEFLQRRPDAEGTFYEKIGRASCRARVCQYG